MSHALQFSHVMDHLWGVDETLGFQTARPAFAIASWIKTHRVNAENAMEVLRLVWPEARIEFELNTNYGENVEGKDLIAKVSFEDQSVAFVHMPAGIGSSVEV